VKETFQIQSSFFFVITDACVKNEPAAIRFLDFIQKLFEELVDNLDDDEKELIADNILGLFTNIDLKYLNFLGELAVLNHLKKIAPYRLISTEFPLIPGKPDGSKIDFQLLNTETRETVLIEIVNIHLGDKNTSDNEKIERLLSQKINEKLLSTGIKESNRFHLIPVLWGQWPEIKLVEAYYRTHNPKFENTTQPVCFMTFEDENGGMVHKFGTIDSIFANTGVK
jgi:hypothetical protein